MGVVVVAIVTAVVVVVVAVAVAVVVVIVVVVVCRCCGCCCCCCGRRCSCSSWWTCPRVHSSQVGGSNQLSLPPILPIARGLVLHGWYNYTHSACMCRESCLNPVLQSTVRGAFGELLPGCFSHMSAWGSAVPSFYHFHPQTIKELPKNSAPLFCDHLKDIRRAAPNRTGRALSCRHLWAQLHCRAEITELDDTSSNSDF